MKETNIPEVPLLDPEAVAEVTENMLSSALIDASAAFCKAVGDPTRMRVLYALSQRELCVGDLSAALGMTKSAVSHQLGLLKSEGLVRSRRSGRNIYYLLDDEHVVDMLNITIEHVRHKKGL